MPDYLRKVRFSEALLPQVQDFECGQKPWEIPLATWIKAGPGVEDSALHSMQENEDLDVWLYLNSNGDIIGYGSLCESRWRHPTNKDKAKVISLIPNVAIKSDHQGKPEDDPPKYSDQIIEDLKAEACGKTGRSPLLGLYVDPRNRKAIHFYTRAGFAEYFRTYVDADGIEYVSMLLRLDDTGQSA